MSEQIKGLEYHAHFFSNLVEIAAAVVDDLSIYDNLPGGRWFQHVDAPQKGGLAGAGRPDYGNHIAGIDGNIDIFQRGNVFIFFS